MRRLGAQLFEVSATDPKTFLPAAAVLAGIAMLPTLIPARRTTTMDPARALEAE